MWCADDSTPPPSLAEGLGVGPAAAPVPHIMIRPHLSGDGLDRLMEAAAPGEHGGGQPSGQLFEKVPFLEEPCVVGIGEKTQVDTARRHPAT